jgi:hypothetical protein
VQDLQELMLRQEPQATLQVVVESAVIHKFKFELSPILKDFPEAQEVQEVALIQVAHPVVQAVRTLGVGVVFT